MRTPAAGRMIFGERLTVTGCCASKLEDNIIRSENVLGSQVAALKMLAGTLVKLQEPVVPWKLGRVKVTLSSISIGISAMNDSRISDSLPAMGAKPNLIAGVWVKEPTALKKLND